MIARKRQFKVLLPKAPGGRLRGHRHAPLYRPRHHEKKLPGTGPGKLARDLNHCEARDLKKA